MYFKGLFPSKSLPKNELIAHKIESDFMKSACFIPIKAYSERIQGKNFRILNEKKLYEHIIDNVLKADCFDEVYVDTDSDEIFDYCRELNVTPIKRKSFLATNTANGNDLLVYHQKNYPEYDYYFQLFATAPYLQPQTITKCFEQLVFSALYDSCFTATAHKSFFWFHELPVNYRPDIMPRTQDMEAVYEETTGLYGITKEALVKYATRIGKSPYIHVVDKFEAVDINTEDDLIVAELIGKVIAKHG